MKLSETSEFQKCYTQDKVTGQYHDYYDGTIVSEITTYNSRHSNDEHQQLSIHIDVVSEEEPSKELVEL